MSTLFMLIVMIVAKVDINGDDYYSIIIRHNINPSIVIGGDFPYYNLDNAYTGARELINK